MDPVKTEQLVVAVFPLDKLVESHYNARKTFDPNKHKELVESIRQKGIQVPLILRPTSGDRFEVVAGARRLRAAREVGLLEIPAVWREMTDEEAREVQLIENLQREDLHPMEEAEAYSRLRERFASVDEIAQRVGKSSAHIRQRLILGNLIPPIAVLFRADEIASNAAFIIARQQEEHQKDVLKWMKREKGRWNFSDLRDFIETNFHLDLSKAPFDTADATLVREAGSCSDCPKRTGHEAALFGDVKKHDTCTDSLCFHAKERAFVQIRIARNPDAVKLSASKDWNEKARGIEEWAATGKTGCKSTKKGIVVQRSGTYVDHQKDFPLGAVLDVCVNQKCAVHRGAGAGPATGKPGGKLTETEKKRRREARRSWLVDQRAHGLMVQELRKDPEIADEEDIRRAALEVAGDYTFKYMAALLAPAFGFEAKGETPSQRGRSGQEKLEKFLKTADWDTCLSFLLAASLTPTGDHDSGGRKEMREAAERFKVDVKKIDKDSLEEEKAKKKARTPKAERKPKTKSAKKKP